MVCFEEDKNEYIGPLEFDQYPAGNGDEAFEIEYLTSSLTIRKVPHNWKTGRETENGGMLTFAAYREQENARTSR